MMRFQSRLAWVAMVTGTLVLAACSTVNDVIQSTKPTPATGRVAFEGEPDIRVRVVAGVVTRQVDGPRRVIIRAKGQNPQITPTPLKITSSGEGIRVVDGSGAERSWGFGQDLEILPSDNAGAPAQSLRVDGTPYPGFLAIRPRWSDRPGVFDVIVSMPIEMYLPGVLSHELWKDWPRQTFECQAVAARTYALHERARARDEGRPFDVENTTVDQVYGGTPTASMPLEAARATRGIILMSEGRILRAYYSSQCGGRAASAKDVWPTKPGWEFNLAKPLQGKARQHFCQRSPLYRWEVTRRDEDVNRRLRSWGARTQNEIAQITRLRSLDVLERNAAERPTSYRLADDRGHEYVLRAEELREALNEPVPSLPAIGKDNRINSGDLEAEVWADTIRFRGRGWGHGVGMCQWCAKGMADAGLDWRQMIASFYPGAEVVKAY